MAATKQRSLLAMLLVSRLRAVLPPGVLTWNDHGYRLAVAPGEFDVHESTGCRATPSGPRTGPGCGCTTGSA